MKSIVTWSIQLECIVTQSTTRMYSHTEYN